MEWEELFINGIYNFAGEPLPIDSFKCLEMICERDILEPCLHLNMGIRFNEFGFLCGKYGAKKIYRYFKGELKKEENINVFVAFTQHYYHGLIFRNEKKLKLKIKKIFSIPEKSFQQIKIFYFLFKEKNYKLLKKFIPLTEQEKSCVALADSIPTIEDEKFNNFIIENLNCDLLVEYMLYAYYDCSNDKYKHYVRFLRDKINPQNFENLNQLCFKLMGVYLIYF